MKQIIKMFLKFGSQENMIDLIENGTIYMNTIEYFRKENNDGFRGDNYEGATKIINSLPGTFRIQKVEREFKYIKVHLKEAYEGVWGNLYCLYCISSHGFPNPLAFKLDERNLKFGTHCVMIKDNVFFLNAIEKGLKERGFKYSHGFVKYYDEESKYEFINL
jgi:hypothetical protein